MINQVWKRLQLMTQSCKVEMLNRQNGKYHLQATGLDGEVLDNIEHIQPYGFSHSPHVGSQAYVIFPNGDRSYGIAFAVGDKQYNMQGMQAGEVAIHDHAGNYVLIGAGGIITVKSSTKVIADTPLFECTQDCKIGGKLEVVGGIKSQGKEVGGTHTHSGGGTGVPN